MLHNIRIVLVRTFHPGNIGSAARAMKTMGLADLVLVKPVDFPSDEALKMAASADDVLANARVVDSLYDALKDCHVVIASTARERAYDLPGLTPGQSAQALLASAVTAKVALVFGPERTGLSNEELQLATHRVCIPTHPAYSSLNLAAAVQTLCYEIYQHSIADEPVDTMFKQDLAGLEDRERFYQHLQETLSETGFIIKNHPGEVMQKFRRLFGRAQPTVEELNILRGALASVQRRILRGKRDGF